MSWFQAVGGLVLLAACDKIPARAAPAPTCVDAIAAVETRARVAGEFYLGHPVICGRGGSNGATCLDTVGGVIWCPVLLTQPCTVRMTPTAPTLTAPTPPLPVEQVPQ